MLGRGLSQMLPPQGTGTHARTAPAPIISTWAPQALAILKERLNGE